jgi:hypothetical protein
MGALLAMTALSGQLQPTALARGMACLFLEEKKEI